MVKVFSNAALSCGTFSLFLAVLMANLNKAQTALSSEHLRATGQGSRDKTLTFSSGGPRDHKGGQLSLSVVNASVAGDFEQFQSPSYCLGLSVGLAKLFSSGNGAAQKSLDARVNVARGRCGSRF